MVKSSRNKRKRSHSPGPGHYDPEDVHGKKGFT